VKVIVTGATGFIGGALVRALLGRGDTVVALTRNVEKARKKLPPGVEAVHWDGKAEGPWIEVFNGADAVVNLAGESAFVKPWTERQKQRILRSRVDATNAVVDAIAKADPRPSVLVNASGMDIYGSQGDTVLTEESPAGGTFLAGVVRQWEAAAKRAEDLGVRVVLLRTSLVLGRQGGILPLVSLPFRFFMGGVIGGKQWVSWIHIDDEVALILYALTHDDIRGPINAAAPNPVPMSAFSKEIGRALHRPVWAPVPTSVLHTVLGEQANVILGSLRLQPKVAQEAGYRFQYPELEAALHEALD
jgi:uncharacterized protein (TIGR01777 family)